jgi:hypothetical protein
MSVLLKIGRDQGKLAEIKSHLYLLAENLKAVPEYRNVKIIFDVDPA